MFHIKKSRENGFTLVEMLVAVSLSTVIIIGLITSIGAFTQQYSVVSTRQNLNTDAQNAIEVINEDIRNSTSIALYNSNPDNNAPPFLSPPAPANTLPYPYSDVAGPTGPDASNPAYNWRMGAGLGGGRLILVQPSRDSNNLPVYTDSNGLTGPVNIIIYYVKNYNLYRRVIAGNGNNTPTFSCDQEADQGGGCRSANSGQKVDRKITGNMSSENGLYSFRPRYFNANRDEINAIDLGGGHYDYRPYASAKSVLVEFQLGKSQTGQALYEYKGSLTQMRSEPVSQITQKTIFPATMSAGPGGIELYWNGQITAQNIATQGKIKGSFKGLFGTPDEPSKVTVANKNCGSGASYGQLCPNTSSPVDLSQNAKVNGNLCATGLSNADADALTANKYVIPGNSGTQFTTGVIKGCTAPDVSLPSFDKTGFVTGFGSNQASGSTASCDGTSPTKTVTIPSKKYTSDIDIYWNCQAQLQGSMYVKGSFTLRYGSIMTVAESVTSTPIIVVNGPINLFRDAKVVPNSKGISPYFISFDSSNSTCSNSDTSCGSSFSASDLQNSVSRSSISMSFNIDAPGSLFYAYYGGMDVSQNGLINAGSVAAQRLGVSYGAQLNLSQ